MELLLITDIRFLIDQDREVEGLAVIADFQGDALDSENVQIEFKEIKDAVLADVRQLNPTASLELIVSASGW